MILFVAVRLLGKLQLDILVAGFLIEIKTWPTKQKARCTDVLVQPFKKWANDCPKHNLILYLFLVHLFQKCYRHSDIRCVCESGIFRPYFASSFQLSATGPHLFVHTQRAGQPKECLTSRSTWHTNGRNPATTSY